MALAGIATAWSRLAPVSTPWLSDDAENDRQHTGSHILSALKQSTKDAAQIWPFLPDTSVKITLSYPFIHVSNCFEYGFKAHHRMFREGKKGCVEKVDLTFEVNIRMFNYFYTSKGSTFTSFNYLNTLKRNRTS